MNRLKIRSISFSLYVYFKGIHIQHLAAELDGWLSKECADYPPYNLLMRVMRTSKAAVNRLYKAERAVLRKYNDAGAIYDAMPLQECLSRQTIAGWDQVIDMVLEMKQAVKETYSFWNRKSKMVIEMWNESMIIILPDNTGAEICAELKTIMASTFEVVLIELPLSRKISKRLDWAFGPPSA